MKEVNFKAFINDNKLDIKALPKPIQENIDTFWKMHKLLEPLKGSEREEELVEQLEQLDYEILGDIEEEFEDELENNDRLEELIKSPLVKTSIKNKAKAKMRTDESILQELVKMGRTTNVRRSALKALGVKSKIEHDAVIGKYQLKKTRFFFHVYNIIPVKK